ncbi:IclR family transcriptional regulator [Rhodococcus sp. WS3]|uniref:IclR family transcriptional regulator domain-containing protein n=1 Tax=unclassified Rhodococcus (in: high G+C Gram-positive bacteria) TaxID=192944 RepID=UPI0005D390F2|nr:MULTISPECIES: IclR family transcriptional regulator C-terminal domain-containing protein [unclassified Rhodococcus (in: high G+C Gram-positive bacteria)]KJF19220.1 p-hydroxybenzoate hydroxylase transcriptional activator [Rhodococcus sp. AD45]ROZ42801.1 IclR family transcriptional regulator [Rhodococcus sp. WS3]RZL20872.1 MAG: IclR family transcriptional regulator [Rhodococcus sp. (in: high G+C Gram-positive bacteria)]
MSASEDFDRRDYIQSIERAISVITAFSHAGPFLSLNNLVAATGLTKQTVRRILMTLERLGFARSAEYQWALTPRVLSLGYAYLSSVNLPAAAQPVMEALTDRIGEGTSLATLDITDVVYINRVQRQRITSINLAVGTRLPAHATSMGHVLLAGLSTKELDEYFELATLHALTDHTLTTRGELTARVDLVRARGWDAVDQELELGRRSAAAPVHDAEGRVVAALSLSCSTASRSFDGLVAELVPTLVKAAQRISAALGDGNYAHRNLRETTQ